MKRIDLSGQKFNSWEVLEYIGKKGYKCRCKCGAVKIVQAGNLTAGMSRSCRQCSANAVETKNKLPYGEAACNAVISHYKQAAKVRGLPWDLSREEAKELFLGNCAYCGKEPSQVLRANRQNELNGDFIYNGLDRVNNELGYSLNNCVPACKDCNYMKKCLTLAEFKDHVRRVALHMELF